MQPADDQQRGEGEERADQAENKPIGGEQQDDGDHQADVQPVTDQQIDDLGLIRAGESRPRADAESSGPTDPTGSAREYPWRGQGYRWAEMITGTRGRETSPAPSGRYDEVVPGADGLLNHDLDPQDRGPQDACGVFGVWAPGEEVAKLTYFGLYALQHRGQESAGIAVSNGRRSWSTRTWAWSPRSSTRPPSSSLRGAPRHRPLPLLHHRGQRLGERPADLPAHRDRSASRSATTAT